MSVRAVSLLAAALFALSACTSTVYYAVLVPHQVAADNTGCFRQCQLLHAGRTNNFLACLDKCPDAKVVHGRECKDVPFNAQQYTCSTEHNQTFNPGPGILAILVAILFWVMVVAFTA